MHIHFDQQLKNLKEKILEMAALTEKSIQLAVESLKKQDKGQAEKIIRDDFAIDALELEIEEKIIEFLATMQPVAVDLRFLTTGMKINLELERIADLAVNIAKRVSQIADQPLLKPLVDIPKLANSARIMVKEAIDAFVNEDKELAKKVILSDSQADRLRNDIYDEIIGYIKKDGSCGPRAVPLILISRHLERICDHATNIAEDIIYMIDAKIVKHHPEKLQNNLKKKKVLFVCIHNSARSQMAEAFLQKYGEGRFKVESAGLEPGRLNPIVVKVMKQAGIDISKNKTKSVFDLYKQGKLYDYLITVCDQAQSERCPVFPGMAKRLHWSFADPSCFSGTEKEKLEKTRQVRDKIEAKIKDWLKNQD